MRAQEAWAFFHKYASTFRKTFDMDLSPYWTPAWGFDSIKFGEALPVGEEESLEDYITGRWGADAAKLVRQMIEENIVGLT